MRGIAAVWVVLFHFMESAAPAFHISPKQPFISTGFLGVDLFFILSGAVLSHVHTQDFATYSLTKHVNFLKLRLARIYPLHVFCLLAFAIAVCALPDFTIHYRKGGLSFTEFLRTLFLFNNWGFGYPSLWNTPTWSLSAEWLGYLFFPAIVIAIRKFVPRNCEPFLVAALLAALVFLTRYAGSDTMNAQGKLGILRMACEFSSGCLLYRSAVRNPRCAALLCWTGVFITAACAYSLAAHWGTVFGLALIVFGLCTEAGARNPIFTNAPAVWLGEISFSLYLSHWPLIQVAQWLISTYQIDPKFTYPILFALFFVCAQLLFRFVEMPTRVYLRSLMKAGSRSRTQSIYQPDKKNFPF